MQFHSRLEQQKYVAEKTMFRIAEQRVNHERKNDTKLKSEGKSRTIRDTL